LNKLPKPIRFSKPYRFTLLIINKKFLFILLTLLLLSACGTTYSIISDREEGIDFDQYKTYLVLGHDHGFPVGANPINHQRIDRAIDTNMQELGYIREESPDLLVAWFVKVENKTDVAMYYDYYRRWRVPQTLNVYEYQEGSLVIDIIDPKIGQVVWHGKASDRVYDDMPNVDKKIKEVVKAMFKRYKKDTDISADNFVQR